MIGSQQSDPREPPLPDPSGGLWGAGLGQRRFSMKVMDPGSGLPDSVSPKARSPRSRGLGASQEPGPSSPTSWAGVQADQDPALLRAGLMGLGALATIWKLPSLTGHSFLVLRMAQGAQRQRSSTWAPSPTRKAARATTPHFKSWSHEPHVCSSQLRAQDAGPVGQKPSD